jgi:hypothetical protein
MKKYASSIVRAGLPIKRKGKKLAPPVDEKSVYAPLDSWEVRKELSKVHGGRPRVKKSKRREYPVTVALNEEEINTLNGYVKRLGCSRAAFVRTAIFMAMGKGIEEVEEEKGRRKRKP